MKKLQKCVKVRKFFTYALHYIITVFVAHYAINVYVYLLCVCSVLIHIQKIDKFLSYMSLKYLRSLLFRIALDRTVRFKYGPIRGY